ncbi:MAG: dTMP kinase [Acidobacteriota bacterium]
MRSPLFVTLEGIEGAGKTTQMNSLSAFLSHSGVEHVTTREPGRTAIGEAVRTLLLDPGRPSLCPLADSLLYNAARAQHLHEVIEPALGRRQVVLCDRYKDSTMAYQGHAGGVPLSLLQTLHRLGGLARDPDLTFLLDLPAEVGLRRARSRQKLSREGLSRFEEMGLAFHQKVREGYLALAAACPERIEIVDATLPPGQVSKHLVRVLQDRLGLGG